jgi:hypothetical protein
MIDMNQNSITITTTAKQGTPEFDKQVFAGMHKAMKSLVADALPESEYTYHVFVQCSNGDSFKCGCFINQFKRGMGIIDNYGYFKTKDLANIKKDKVIQKLKSQGKKVFDGYPSPM